MLLMNFIKFILQLPQEVLWNCPQDSIILEGHVLTKKELGSSFGR